MFVTHLSLTTEQLATIERALQRTTFDLHENYEANAVRDDELRLVQEALTAIYRNADNAGFTGHAHRFVRDE